MKAAKDSFEEGRFISGQIRPKRALILYWAEYNGKRLWARSRTGLHQLLYVPALDLNLGGFRSDEASAERERYYARNGWQHPVALLPLKVFKRLKAKRPKQMELL